MHYAVYWLLSGQLLPLYYFPTSHISSSLSPSWTWVQIKKNRHNILWTWTTQVMRKKKYEKERWLRKRGGYSVSDSGSLWPPFYIFAEKKGNQSHPLFFCQREGNINVARLFQFHRHILNGSRFATNFLIWRRPLLNTQSLLGRSYLVLLVKEAVGG